MVALETPARRASSRCESPRRSAMRPQARADFEIAFAACSCVQYLERSEQAFNWTIAARRRHCSENRSTARRRPMSTAAPRAEVPNDLEAFWLPFTPNRAFKKRPRLISRAKDMHYYTPEGPRDPRRDGGAVVLQRRPQPPADRRGDPAPGGRARFLADLPVRPSHGVRSSPRASPRWRRAISIMSSSPIPARRPATPR